MGKKNEYASKLTHSATPRTNADCPYRAKLVDQLLGRTDSDLVQPKDRAELDEPRPEIPEPTPEKIRKRRKRELPD